MNALLVAVVLFVNGVVGTKAEIVPADQCEALGEKFLLENLQDGDQGAWKCLPQTPAPDTSGVPSG